jgi:hypothetical protein
MVVTNNEIDGNKKYTSNAGDFDGHADTLVQCGAHRPVERLCSFNAKPLDAAIGQVPVPYHPGGCHG